MIQLPSEDYQKVIESIKECLSNIKAVQLRSSAYYAKLGIDHLPIIDVKTTTNVSNLKASTLRPQQSDHQNSAESLLDDNRNDIVITETELSRTITEKSTVSSITEAKNNLRINERKNGYVHEQTLVSLIILAQTYETKFSFFLAELLYKRAFVAILDSETYGPWHTDTARLLELLSEVEIEQGKFLEAAGNLMYLLKFQKKMNGETHLNTTRTMARIAVLYDKLQRWEDAEKLYLSVIEAREQERQGETVETLNVMENLALSYRLRGKKTLERSVRMYTRVLNIRKRQFGTYEGKIDPQTKKTLRESSEYASLWDLVSKLMDLHHRMGHLASRRELLGECLSHVA